MDLRDAVAAIETSIGNPHEGLPMEVFLFISRITPITNVDLLIKDDRGRTLLTWRDDEFYGRGWHVPGSIIRYKETFAERIGACARDELGVDVSIDGHALWVLEGIAPQADRGHAISLLFRCSLLGAPDEAKRARTDAPSAGQWRWHAGAPADLLDAHRPYAQFL